MEFILDVHVHTVLSGHAHSTLSENAAYAASIGLKFIGMADHGPGLPGGAHLYNFGNLWSMPDFLHGVRIFKGVEANIMDTSGRLDLPDEMLKKMDFVIASIHFGIVVPTTVHDHTKAIVGAMENKNVHIIGHPFDKRFELDMDVVVRAAARTKTILEINNQSLNPGSQRYRGDDVFLEMLRLCKKYGVPVLASSDAHVCTNVGSFADAKALIEEAGLSEEEVANTCDKRFLSAIGNKRSVYDKS